MMKQIVSLALAVTVFAFSATAQRKKPDVPESVKNTFAQTYPKASHVKWDQEINNYEADFRVDGKNGSIWYDTRGNCVKSEEQIDVHELPKEAREYIHKTYPSGVPDEARKVLKGKMTSYTVEVRDRDISFDHDGKVISDKKH